MNLPARLDARRAARWLAFALGIIVIAGLAGWWWTGQWRPDRTAWPIQGVAVSAENQPLSWPTLAATGAQFAYIDATRGRSRVNHGFSDEHDRALAAGLRVGAIHHYALCQFASEQASPFVRLVPREADALPPAVMLDDDPDCTRRPSRALLLSELTTFLNQVETHMGKPAIIAPSADLEAEYRLSAAINRPLWLRRNWREPEATIRPWVIWQANDHYRAAGAQGGIRALVLHGPGE